MIGRMPIYAGPTKPLQFATTDLLTVPESNVLNAALALVRAKQAQLGEMFLPFLHALQKSDPDMARLLFAAEALDRGRKADKKRREEHHRQTRSVRGRHTLVDMSDPPSRGGSVVISGSRTKSLRYTRPDGQSGLLRDLKQRPDDPEFTNPGLV